MKQREHHPAKRRSALELLWLVATLVLYLLILETTKRFEPSTGPALRLFLPNLWLLGMSALSLRRGAIDVPLFHSGPKFVVGAVTTTIIILLIVTTLLLWDGSPFGRSFASPEHWLALIALVPLSEELFFRGLLFYHLRTFVGAIGAVLLVTVIFAALHFSRGLLIPMTVLSIGTCLLLLSTRSLLWPTILHLGWNALSIVHVLGGQARWIVAAVSIACLAGLTIWGVTTRKKGGGEAAL